MTTTLHPADFPYLSLLIFSPLAAAAIAALLGNARLLRWWTFLFTTALAIFSLQIYWRFDRPLPTFSWLKMSLDSLDAHHLPPGDRRHQLVTGAVDHVDHAALCSRVLAIYHDPGKGIHDLPPDHGDRHGRRVLCARLHPVLHLLGSDAHPDEFADWRLGGPRKVYAALKFFIYTMAGSMLLLVAIIALYIQVGTFSIPEMLRHSYAPALQTWLFLAFFVAFAIKVPMFPFHTWLPAAHVEAPTAGSVLLASVLLKMGTYGFLRFSLH